MEEVAKNLRELSVLTSDKIQDICDADGGSVIDATISYSLHHLSSVGCFLMQDDMPNSETIKKEFINKMAENLDLLIDDKNFTVKNSI